MSNEKLQSQIKQMLILQNEMNTKVHPQWREQKFSFYRAIWTECAELMDHYGWKWWKKQEPDMDQIRLEIVDIWHFGLSIKLQQRDDSELIAQELATVLENATTDHKDFRTAIEDLALATIETKGFSINHFTNLLVLSDFSTDALFQQYVGKNVLNFFRQDHGYKDGSYIKIWNGQEDNEHLAEILTQLDASSDSFREDVYQQLQARYPDKP